MTHILSAFRIGDVRGLYPQEINEDFASAFAHGIAYQFDLRGTVAVGRDMRASSIPLQQSLIDGLLSSGLNVIDLGLCASEVGYFASSLPGIEAAIVVTASHNPPDYNGFKVVLNNGRAVNFADGLSSVMQLMQSGQTNNKPRGQRVERDVHSRYLDYLQSRFAPFRSGSFRSCASGTGSMALNGLNGTAATLASDIAARFDLPTTWFRQEPGPIPDEGADPCYPRLADEMQAFMQSGQGAPFSLGVAWDGDCDRCVFFDSEGKLAPTYYVVGLLAAHHLKKQAGLAVVFDTKLCWNTLDIIRHHRGIAVPSETGHAFMKQHMRNSQAVYGGELSSHHYFGEFNGCDSGMLAWLKILEVLDQADASLLDLINQAKENVCCTPEFSLQLRDVDQAFELIKADYASDAINIDHFDGLSFEMPGDWRFTLRRSKTEARVRLNLEARGAKDRLLNEGGRLLTRLSPFQADDSDWFELLAIQ